MKKSKLPLGLVTTFVASLALAGCSGSIKGKDGSLVTFTGHNGKVYDIVTDKMYSDYLKGVSGISNFYDKVLEVLIRYEFQYGKKASTKKSYDTIVTEANNDVNSEKETARNNAESNNTSYSKEWSAILESNGVDSVKELKEKFIYQIEQEQLEDWYLDENENVLTKQFVGIEENGPNKGKAVTQEGYPDLLGRLPYHIRHILVKIDNDGNNYGTGTITDAQASKLYQAVHALKLGEYSFGDVAKTYSDDTSKDDYGDVNIMTNKASEDGSLPMFAEFQLGIYVYDALIKNKNTNYEGVTLGLGLTDKVKTFVNNNLVDSGFTKIPGLVEVPYNVFEDLNEVSDLTSDDNAMKVANGKETAYPRNILFNKYLNHHNPFVITNIARKTFSSLTDADFNTDANKINPDSIDASARDASITVKAPHTTGFMKANDLGLSTDNNTLVLTDENDNVIIGLRSSSGGIHFIVVQKSIFDINDGEGANVSLAQYYTTKIPSDSDHYPHDNQGRDKATYVNFINARGDKTVYETRASSVKEAIKSFDSTYKYRLYDWLINEYSGRLSFNEKFHLDTEIKNYVDSQRELNAVNQKDGMAKAWDKYIELIEAQNETRTTKTSSNVYTRVLPECCVIGFKDKLEELKDSTDPQDKALYAAYQKGGMCYYGE